MEIALLLKQIKINSLFMDNVENDKVQDWYFTFPQKSNMRNRYVKLRGTFQSTRDRMNESFGNNWAFQYSKDQWIFKKKDDPSAFNQRCWVMGINPVGLDQITQAELYNLKQV